MEARTLQITRWMTHLMLGMSAVGVMAVAWELNQKLEDRESSEERQFKVRNNLESLRAKNPFKSIHRSLELGQTNEAHEKLSQLNRKLQALEVELQIKRGEELDKLMLEHARLVQEAAAFSKPQELIQTLSDKVSKLADLASARRWSNLMKMSQRMSARLAQLAVNSRVESPLVRFMESDLTAMTSLIRGSSLEETDKNEVLRQLEGIRQEVAMMLDLHQSRRGFNELYKQTDVAMGRWAARADLAVGTIKQRAHEAVRSSVNRLWLVGVFLTLGWVAVGIAWAQARRAQQRRFDDGLIELLNEGIVGDKLAAANLVGPARRDEFMHAMKLLKKRLRLGEDFQAGLPFASVLVDHHLNLIWGNSLFCEQFGIDPEDLKNDYAEWINVFNRIAGPEIDPVRQAIEEGAPGTWQIKLQMHDGVSIPLEMHVSAIEGQKFNKALVVFYPMAMMQEAISEQAQIVMAPVRSALEALENEAWSIELEAKLAPQWQHVGLGADWEKLSRTIHRLDQTRNDLLLQAQRLENEKHDQLKAINDLSGLLESRGHHLRAQMQLLKNVRDGLVSLDQLGSDLGMEHSALLAESKSLVKKFDLVFDTSRGAIERLKDAKDSVAQLEKTKQAYRVGKQEIQDTKQEMVKLHNVFINSVADMDENSQQIAADMKDLLIKLDRAIRELDNRMTGFDVQITKLAMAFAGPVPELERSGHLIDLQAHERVAREITEAMQEDQEMIIDRLKTLVEELKRDTKECLQAPQLHSGEAQGLEDLA